LLFKQKDLKGIKSGEVSLAFRSWKTARVKKSSLIKSAVGLIRIVDIYKVKRSAISHRESRQAGFDDLEQLLSSLNSDNQEVFKVSLQFHSEDPRIALRNKTTLSHDEFKLLLTKLKKMDSGKFGSWTMEVMQAIKQNPGLSSTELATIVSREKHWLKIHIRKLKNLGLTISESVGYRLSPLGEYYLMQRRRKTDL